jgi:hypothetical protein
MPGPKMGARPRDFDEELVRRSPTYRKWECLAPGERLRYACREFLKGHGDDEERLMRRIMIARRNNVRDHDALKLARHLQSSTSISTPSQPLENMIVNDNQKQQQKQQQHEQEGNDVVKNESAIGAAPNDDIDINNENGKGEEETKIANNDDDNNDNINHNNIISRCDGEMEEMISRTPLSGVLPLPGVLPLLLDQQQQEEHPHRRRRRPTTLISDDVIRMEMDGKLVIQLYADEQR